MLGEPWTPRGVDDVRQMRQKLEAAANPRSLKRGRGGISDVEFLVQLLQLKYGRDNPEILRPNVWDALDALEAAGRLVSADATTLRDGYSFLRLVEARLRIVTDRPLTEVPDAQDDLAKLARRLGFEPQDGETAAARFLAELGRATAAVRGVFDTLTLKERG